MSQLLQQLEDIERHSVIESRLSPEEANDFIRRWLQAHGEHCGQCGHLIVLEHKDGQCFQCGCVRKRRESKKGMGLSELFDMEAQ